MIFFMKTNIKSKIANFQFQKMISTLYGNHILDFILFCRSFKYEPERLAIFCIAVKLCT